MTYKKFNYTYDKAALAALDQEFNDAPRLTKGPYQSLDSVILNNDLVKKIIQDFRPVIGDSILHQVGLTRIVDGSTPYISPGNNGLIFLPVSGNLQVKFYSYRPTIQNGRPTLDPAIVTQNADLKNSIIETLSETINIDQPTAINGLKVHSVSVDSSAPALAFIVKIPKDVSWDAVDYGVDDLS